MARWIEIQNVTDAAKPPVKARLCDTFLTRFRGLMLQKSIQEDQGILIDEKSDSIINSAIHMFFMRFPIAVIWINSSHEIVDTKIARPWIPYLAPAKPARYILETHPSRLLDYKAGDRVKLIHV